MALTRRGRLTVTLVVVAMVGAGTAYVITRTTVGAALGLSAGPACTLTVGDESLDWSTEQAMTATTVAGVGTRIGATVNGVAAAVERSLDPEASDDPDADPGADPDAAVPAAAARETYRGLPDVARPGPDAVRVAEALLGHHGRALTCVLPLAAAADDLPREDPGPSGLTPRADTVRTEMRDVFGKQTLGGFEPGGVDSGHIDGSAHYEGRAVDIFFRPVTVANQRLGWQQVMWSVAHADRLHIATVIFDREVWTSGRSLEGWRPYRYPGGETDDPVLLHEDHVHVDVVEGG